MQLSQHTQPCNNHNQSNNITSSPSKLTPRLNMNSNLPRKGLLLKYIKCLCSRHNNLCNKCSKDSHNSSLRNLSSNLVPIRLLRL